MGTVRWLRDLAAEIIKGSHPVYLCFLSVIDGKWHFCGSSALYEDEQPLCSVRLVIRQKYLQYIEHCIAECIWPLLLIMI